MLLCFWVNIIPGDRLETLEEHGKIMSFPTSYPRIPLAIDCNTGKCSPFSYTRKEYNLLLESALQTKTFCQIEMVPPQPQVARTLTKTKF